MHTLTIPISGRLLVAHLAAYGLGAALHAAGEPAFIAHDPDALEMDAQVRTPADPETVAACVHATARACQPVIEADLEPNKTGNDRRPVIWARATRMDRAHQALAMREQLLDGIEERDGGVAASLVAALGAPGAWLGERPQHGASSLDGVIGNHTSDFVRGVLRRTLPAASLTADKLDAFYNATEPSAATENDRTGWSPPGTQVHPAHQWLAAIGLTQLPVGLAAHGPSRTPCCWRDTNTRGVNLPVFSQPTSIPRLRALLQAPALVTGSIGSSAAGRLRALGIHELVSFPLLNRSTGQSVAFSFGRGIRKAL
jgi:hypothetical protein